MKSMVIVLSFIFISNVYGIVLGTNDLVSVSSSETPAIIKELAKTVGHIKTSIIFPSKCTGVLISKSLFLTTTSCIPSHLTAGRIRVYFNNIIKDNTDKYKVKDIVLRDGPSQIVLLRLKKNPGLVQGFLKVSSQNRVGESLGYIENDSKSHLLQFMSAPCEVKAFSESEELAHDCDTTSEGAPLINERLELVGLQKGFYFTSPVLNNALSTHKYYEIIKDYIFEDN